MAIVHFSKIGIDGEYTKLSILAELPKSVPHIIRGLSSLMVGDVRCARFKRWEIRRELSRLKLHELKAVINDILPLLGGDDFFASAASLKSLSGIAAKQK